VVVALTLASLSMALLLGAVSQGLRNVQTADRYVEATRRAQSHLAEIGVTAPLTPGVLSGNDGGGFAWRTQVFPPRVHPPGPKNAQTKPLALYAVQATVSWKAGAQERSVTLQSKRLGPP
jgi:general secretion pathway protein I